MAHDILIVDDEADIRALIAGILSDEGYTTREASSSDTAFAAISQRQPHLVILDVWLKGSQYDGLQILEMIRRDHPEQQVIMISGHGTIDMAVSATKSGAYDFITKPFKTEVLLHTVARAVEQARLRRENAELQTRAGGRVDDFVGVSPLAQQLRQAIGRVASTDSRILLSGPPGTGKSLVARLVHERSHRRDGRFVILNCANLVAETLEAAMFGSEAGDAKPRHLGVLEEAHQGTLLLDEVADMPIEVQGRIARVLHKQSFQRVGGRSEVDVDVRVLATTSRDLDAAIAAGAFREDLYYRLNVVPMELPPLKMRRDDIPHLAQHFMARSALAKGRPPRPLGEDALAALQAHDWPGNAWELINVIERLILVIPEEIGPLRAEAVTAAIGQGVKESMKWDRATEVMNLPLRDAREAFEREYLVFHLTRFGGNISRTAEFVGMDRAALHRKLKLLGVQNAARPQRISA